MIRGTLSGSKLLSLCLLVAAALSGCTTTKPRTQVMLVVDADTEVQSKATALRIEIDGRPLGTETYEPMSDQTYPPVEADGMSWPYEIAILPRSGGEKREFRITATVYNGNDAIARLRAESGFVSRKTLELKLRFDAACLYAKSLECLQNETCLDGGCVPSRIDQATLPDYTDEPSVNIPVGDGGQGTTSNPQSTAGSGGSGMAVGSAGMSGAGPDIDPSMPANCGDGKLTGDEKCDIAIPEGMPGACPKTCGKASACEPTRLEGSGCQARCTPYTITAFDSGDECCPEGADGNSDTDCRASCGNGTIEAGESCDPVDTCPTAATCVSANVCLKAVVVGDPASCTAQCTMQPIIECMSGDGCCPMNCTNANDTDCSASCGDGVISDNEKCELNSTVEPCPTSCNDENACTTDLFTGSPANCNSECTTVPITAPKRDDGCCPPGANANNDNDCQPRCGNNIVEPGERCDGRCPTAANCNDFNPCTIDRLSGSGCTVQCVHEFILLPSNGDGCCPALIGNANNDNDCSPICGNGVVEDGERCDGNCPNANSCNDGNACTRDEVIGSSCQRQCRNTQLGPSGATKDGCCPGTGMTSDTDADCPSPAPACGNKKKDGTELCDPPDVACPACVDDGDPCTRERVTPNPDACHPKCDHVSLKGETDGRCCPAGGTPDDDPDCKPVQECGDGDVTGTEKCDPPEHPCPPCESNKCSKAVVGGTPCSPTCDHQMITSPAPNDDCCPPNANANTDNDCEPFCGNGVQENGEACDGGPKCDSQCNEIMEPMGGTGGGEAGTESMSNE